MVETLPGGGDHGTLFESSTGTMAAIRNGPPLPPAILIGMAITTNPVAGNPAVVTVQVQNVGAGDAGSRLDSSPQLSIPEKETLSG